MTNKKRTLYLCYFAYGLIGLVFGIRTPLFFYVQQDYLDSFSHLGTLVLISGIGMQGTLYVSGILIEKYGYMHMLKVGITSITIPVLLMGLLPGITGFDFAFTFFMLGYGITVLPLNMYVSAIEPKRKANVLMILHLSFAIGALIGPKFISLLVTAGVSWHYVMVMTSLPFIALTLQYIRTPSSDIGKKLADLSPSLDSIKKNSFGFLPLLFILVYMAGQTWEFGIGTWFSIFSNASKGLTANESAVYLTLFYFMYPIFRIIFAKIIHHLNLAHVLLFAFLSTAVFILLGIVTSSLVFYALTGIGTSLMYPATMSLMQEAFGDHASRRIGSISMIGGLIQYVAIWLVGLMSDQWGMLIGFNTLLLYPLIGGIAIVAIHKILLHTKVSVAVV